MNCSVIPEPLFESELFGYRKGSFTGAIRDHQGLLQAAHGGTLFLDEIGDMPVMFQPKLLRALQEKQVRPIGSVEVTPVDVRILSASHHDLDEEVKTGKFRPDLYYRLNVVTLEVPPLSKRREDIPLLVAHFLTQILEKSKKKVTGFSPEAMELFISAPWPGNVRQLSAVPRTVERTWDPGSELLVLFTDGMTDARDRFDKRFGEEAVLEVVNAHQNAPPKVILEHVLNRLQQHMGDVMRRDDLTMVITRA
jgi:two-component system response regulator GlrR